MTRVALLLLLAAGCSRHHYVNEAARNAPNVFLHDVRMTGDGTELVFRIEADEACEIGVPPPGDPAAFVLRAGERTFALREVEGVAELPGKTSVDARASQRFSLTFEPLPQDVQEFDVVGELAGTSSVSFGVRMDAPSVVKSRW